MENFPKTCRLRKKADFESVFLRAKKMTAGCLLLLYKPNEFKENRLGIVLPKKHLKSAVLRNKGRRLIRETFRKQQKEIKSFDIIILLRAKLKSEDLNELPSLVHTLLGRLIKQI